MARVSLVGIFLVMVGFSFSVSAQEGSEHHPDFVVEEDLQSAEELTQELIDLGLLDEQAAYGSAEGEFETQQWWRRTPRWRYPGYRNRIYICYARDARGRTYMARGYRPNIVENRVMRRCYRNARYCRSLGCRYSYY